MSHGCCSGGKHALSYVFVVGWPEKRGNIQSVGGRRNGEEFPIAGMTGETNQRPAIVFHVVEVFLPGNFYPTLRWIVFINFEVSERTILPYLSRRPKSNEKGGFQTEGKQLRITLSDGTEYPVRGAFDFIDNAVNPETGTIPARAKFENDEGALAAGIFVRIGIPETIKGAVLVPRFAVQRDLGGDFVLLATAENDVERRLVTPTPFTEGEFRIIEGYDEEKGTGLKAGERVIVSNLQRARPGVKVAPIEGEATPAPAADAGEETPAEGDAAPAGGDAEPAEAPAEGGN